jgi:hypothetical protein
MHCSSLCVCVYIYRRCRDSSVGIATGYGVDGSRIESRWGARFFAHVQTDPEAHPAFCTMGTGSFPGLKRPGRGADYPPLLVPRSKKSSAIPLTPSGPSDLLGVLLPLCICIYYIYKLTQLRLTADWLAPRETDCSRFCSTVCSDWLPSYIKITERVVEIFKMISG